MVSLASIPRQHVRKFSAIIWSMRHIDYSSGLIPYSDVPSKLEPYTCYDSEGRLIKVKVKFPPAHQSWEPINAEPVYHYNLGYIIANPDLVEPSTSQTPQAKQHRQDGEVLIYSKFGYIISLDAPFSYQFPTDKTEVVVKYTHDENDDNITLTSQIRRTWRS